MTVRLVDTVWLTTGSWRVLHHVALTDGQVELLENDGYLGLDNADGPFLLDCGQRATVLHLPGVLTRLGVPRCSRCCRATGLPEGEGSPRNDPACREILGLAKAG